MCEYSYLLNTEFPAAHELSHVTPLLPTNDSQNPNQTAPSPSFNLVCWQESKTTVWVKKYLIELEEILGRGIFSGEVTSRTEELWSKRSPENMASPRLRAPWVSEDVHGPAQIRPDYFIYSGIVDTLSSTGRLCSSCVDQWLLYGASNSNYNDDSLQS